MMPVLGRTIGINYDRNPKIWLCAHVFHFLLSNMKANQLVSKNKYEIHKSIYVTVMRISAVTLQVDSRSVFILNVQYKNKSFGLKTKLEIVPSGQGQDSMHLGLLSSDYIVSSPAVMKLMFIIISFNFYESGWCFAADWDARTLWREQCIKTQWQHLLTLGTLVSSNQIFGVSVQGKYLGENLGLINISYIYI